MRNILIMGGTVFVSRYAAEYFVKKGDRVTVLNRNSRPQVTGVELIEADRHQLGDVLKNRSFDAVLDITAYTEEDIKDLMDALGDYGTYILISSSAVYPETKPQPFDEKEEIGPNSIWGKYGTDKVAAEKLMFARDPQAYSIRPPYIYGPMNNAYREAFVFDCADADRPFVLPPHDDMGLQFFHIDDLCRLMDIIIDTKPDEHILNCGNAEMISVRDWVTMCYEIAGKEVRFVKADEETPIRSYFSFADYEYMLKMDRQAELMPDLIDLREGMKQSYAWYHGNEDQVKRRPFIEFIDEHFSL